ncbi:MAG: coenzyme F420-0:L-glutamate ligase [Minisyncoccota bacterium]
MLTEKPQTYTQMKEQTGLVISYVPREDGSVAVEAVSDNAPPIEAVFAETSIDEARILYMEATELLLSRAKLKETQAAIRGTVDRLFAAFRGERVSFADESAPSARREASGEFVANPGKQLAIDVDGVSYLRLPVRTRLITTKDTDLLPLIEEYVSPYLASGDIIFISEKALTITQGRIVDMSSIKPTRLARFLARKVGNSYGSSDFHGFGHGTSLAMQLFLEEAGYPRVLFAAAVSAVTRPFRIRGLFYAICGKRAKSIDCPMSFLILEYAHAVKLAPNDPSGAARRIKEKIGGHEVVIVDANYRGAFSLGKSTRAISESFIGKLFRDNPAGQSDEMTPFVIVRKA